MIKNDLTDALALWGIGRCVANSMGVEYALRFAENGINTPFVRDLYLRGAEGRDFPTKEEFDA